MKSLLALSAVWLVALLAGSSTTMAARNEQNLLGFNGPYRAIHKIWSPFPQGEFRGGQQRQFNFCMDK